MLKSDYIIKEFWELSEENEKKDFNQYIKKVQNNARKAFSRRPKKVKNSEFFLLECTLKKSCGFKDLKGFCDSLDYCRYKLISTLIKPDIKCSIEQIVFFERHYRLLNPCEIEHLISPKCLFLINHEQNIYLLFDEDKHIYNMSTHKQIK